ncbi:MAG: Sensor protein resE [Candidatus Saccharibacteria bacterium]|nr:Sensor protein resE [Candidatus Saccharibacteria bacterium]
MITDLIILVTCSVAISLLGLLVILRNPKKRNNQRFVFLSFTIVFWTVTNFLSDNAASDTLLYTRLTFFAGVLTTFALMGFLENFPNNTAVKGSILIRLHAIMTALLLPVTFLPEFISAVHISGSEGSIETGLLYNFFIFYISFSLLLLAPVIIRSQYRHAVTYIQKQQIMTISWGIIIYAVLAVISSVVLPLIVNDWSSSSFGPAFALILVGMVTYTIVKHGLFDIRLAAVRSVAYVLSLIVLAVIYYLLAYIVSVTLFKGEVSSTVSLSPINIILALLLAFIFQPIKSFFDKTTDTIFYRDRYHTDEFYARLSEVLTTTTDLRNLLERASSEIGTTLKAEQAFFFVQYNHVHHVSAGTLHHSSLPLKDAHRLNEYVKKDGQDVIVTELLPDNHAVHRLLISHRVAVLMPLMRGSTVLGYLALGEQRSSGYTNRDIKVLKTISDELVIAIQNSLSVQEVRDINVHLQQRINTATAELRSSNTQLRHLDKTKDEFLSMASHQLRTPLTSVKGYLSMVLEGDAGKVTDTQRRLLGEAFTSSERMVHLIHDFLNVSRLQTGKFMLELHPYDIVKLVDEEVRSLQRAAETRNMKLEFINTIGELMLNIDENKIRQVVMNFIDNALFYSHDESTIKVELNKTEDQIELRVKDTGIGVPKGEQAHLFSKFYRASNARKQRPDGTGVGIFLAKKVVTEHGGDVLFESTEGKGSTFGFTLPIKKLAVTSDEKLDELNQ